MMPKWEDRVVVLLGFDCVCKLDLWNAELQKHHLTVFSANMHQTLAVSYFAIEYCVERGQWRFGSSLHGWVFKTFESYSSALLKERTAKLLNHSCILSRFLHQPPPICFAVFPCPVTTHKAGFPPFVCMFNLMSRIVVDDLTRFGLCSEVLALFFWFADKLQSCSKKIAEHFPDFCMLFTSIFALKHESWVVKKWKKCVVTFSLWSLV